jgi:hypothetical protein
MRPAVTPTTAIRRSVACKAIKITRREQLLGMTMMTTAGGLALASAANAAAADAAGGAYAFALPQVRVILSGGPFTQTHTRTLAARTGRGLAFNDNAL